MNRTSAWGRCPRLPFRAKFDWLAFGSRCSLQQSRIRNLQRGVAESLCRRILHLGIDPIERHPQQRQQHEEKDAAFRPDRAAGQPARAVQRECSKWPGGFQPLLGTE